MTDDEIVGMLDLIKSMAKEPQDLEVDLNEHLKNIRNYCDLMLLRFKPKGLSS